MKFGFIWFSDFREEFEQTHPHTQTREPFALNYLRHEKNVILAGNRNPRQSVALQGPTGEVESWHLSPALSQLSPATNDECFKEKMLCRYVTYLSSGSHFDQWNGIVYTNLAEIIMKYISVKSFYF